MGLSCYGLKPTAPVGHYFGVHIESVGSLNSATCAIYDDPANAALPYRTFIGWDLRYRKAKALLLAVAIKTYGVARFAALVEGWDEERAEAFRQFILHSGGFRTV